MFNFMGLDCFFGCAFVVKEKDHVTFDILYYATSLKTRYIFSIISALAIIFIMGWSFLPTLDYIDWMKMRKTTTVKIPFLVIKFPLSTFFLFMVFFYCRLSFNMPGKLKNY